MPPELDTWWAKRKLYEKRRLDHSCLHCFVFPTWGKGTLCYTSYIFNSLTFNKYARIFCTSVIIINKPEGVSKMSSLMSDHKIGNLSFHLRITLQNLLCSAMGLPDVSYPDDSYSKLRWFVPNAKMIRTQSLDASYPKLRWFIPMQ